MERVPHPMSSPGELRSFAFAAAVVCHCMLETESGPPQESGRIPLHVEHPVDDPLAIPGQDGVEIAAAHCFEIWTCRHHALGDVDADLAPLVDHPSGIVFIGLVDIAVQQLKAELFGASVVQETLRLRTRLLDVGRKPRDLLQLFLGRGERRAGKDDSANRMHVR
jgi:hypothetical protein